MNCVSGLVKLGCCRGGTLRRLDIDGTEVMGPVPLNSRGSSTQLLFHSFRQDTAEATSVHSSEATEHAG